MHTKLEDSIRLDWLDKHKKELIQCKLDGSMRRVVIICDLIIDDNKKQSIREMVDESMKQHNNIIDDS